MEAQVVNEPIAKIEKFRVELAKIREQNDSLVFNYEDKKENKAARSHVAKLRSSKAAVEKTRKEEKDYFLEMGRKIDEVAKEITGEIDGMIKVHKDKLDEVEQREAVRLKKHSDNLRSMESFLILNLDFGSARLKDGLAKFNELHPEPNESWEEFKDQATELHAKVLNHLKVSITKAEQYEKEQAELEELRKEKARRDQEEKDRLLKEEAAAKAKAEAEQKAKAEIEAIERKAQLEKEAAERREQERLDEINRQKQEAENARLKAEADAKRAEEEKLAAEKRAIEAERLAKEKAERELKEAQEREAAEKAKREADEKHRNSILAAAEKCFIEAGFTDKEAVAIVSLIATGSVKNVTINF